MNISVKVSGVDNILDQLKKVKVDTDKVETALDELASYGAKEAQIRYSFAKTDGNENPAVTWVTDLGKGRRIIASGEDVAFIEFGTGILNKEHPLQYEVQGIVGHGLYGKGLGANPKGWWYNGVRHIGIDAQRCLYDTGKELERMIPEKFKEVFR